MKGARIYEWAVGSAIPVDRNNLLKMESIMAKQSLLRELIQFAMREKKWWLVPLLVILVLIGGLIIFAQSSALAPFLYPFF
ncbi:MAG: DUF5989 family protein [Verrucomicrobia bacterium]|nr:DUF5989 family protein [Verrucomicrobiota bacterium]